MKFQICFLFTIVLSNLISNTIGQQAMFKIGSAIVDALRNFDDFSKWGEKDAVNFGIFLDDLQSDVYNFITTGRTKFVQTRNPDSKALDGLYRLTIGYILLTNSIEYKFLGDLKNINSFGQIKSIISQDLKNAFTLINDGIDQINDEGVPKDQIVPNALVSFKNVQGPYKGLLNELNYH